MHQILNRGPGIRLAARRVRPAAENPARSSVRWLLVRSSEQQGAPFARSPCGGIRPFSFPTVDKEQHIRRNSVPLSASIAPAILGMAGANDYRSRQLGDGLRRRPEWSPVSASSRFGPVLLFERLRSGSNAGFAPSSIVKKAGHSIPWCWLSAAHFFSELRSTFF